MRERIRHLSLTHTCQLKCESATLQCGICAHRVSVFALQLLGLNDSNVRSFTRCIVSCTIFTLEHIRSHKGGSELLRHLSYCSTTQLVVIRMIVTPYAASLNECCKRWILRRTLLLVIAPEVHVPYTALNCLLCHSFHIYVC